MPTPDGRIGSRDICTGAAVERVIADGGVTSLKISATLQSDNFSAGSQGWQISRATGSAEFQDAVIRGSLNASDITTGTLNTSVLANGSIGMGKIEVQAALVTNQYLQSSSYSAGSSGWRINADGTAEFQDAVIRGSLNATDIDAGTMEADYLGAGVIGAEAIYLSNSASSFIASSNGTDWYIRGDGVAYFQDVTVAGVLATSSVTGDLTLSGGSFRTASSGDRLILSSSGLYGYNWLGQNTGQLTMWGTAVSMLWPGGAGLYLSSSSGSISVGNEGMGVDSASSVAYMTVNSSTKIEAHSGYLYVADEIQGDDGSEGSPGYSFSNASSTGMWRNSSDRLYWSLGGSWKLGLTSTRLETRTGIGIYSGNNGSVSSPGLTFSNATSAGIYVSGGFCGMGYGGSAVVVGNGSNQLYLGGMTSNAGSGTLRYIGSQIYYYASSERFKHDIHPAAWDLDPDTLLDWEPVWYRFNDNPQDRQLGFIAEQVYDTSGEYLVKRDQDGLIHNNDEDAMRVLMVEKIKQLDQRIAALEGAAA